MGGVRFCLTRVKACDIGVYKIWMKWVLGGGVNDAGHVNR
jgi:hypothetical protein